MVVRQPLPLQPQLEALATVKERASAVAVPVVMVLEPNPVPESAITSCDFETVVMLLWLFSPVKAFAVVTVFTVASLVVDRKKHIDPQQPKAGTARAKRAVDAAPIAAIFLNIIIFTPLFFN
jgi:hypothetical protein